MYQGMDEHVQTNLPSGIWGPAVDACNLMQDVQASGAHEFAGQRVAAMGRLHIRQQWTEGSGFAPPLTHVRLFCSEVPRRTASRASSRTPERATRNLLAIHFSR